MSMKGIRWVAALGGAVAAEVAQIVAAFVWVAFYSYVLNPGQSMAVYEQHAQSSGPWVSIIAGFPIFYLASRWIAKSVPTALALFGIFLAIDVSLLVMMVGQYSGPLLLPMGLSSSTKLLACYLGGRHGSIKQAGVST